MTPRTRSPHGFKDPEHRNARTLLELAFAEDLGTDMPAIQMDLPSGAMALHMVDSGVPPGDVTALSTIPANARGAARFVARSGGVIAGLPVVELCAWRFGLPAWFEPLVEDGQAVAPGTPIAYLAGPMRELLMMERTALNFLQRLSGVATQTRRFVEAVAGTRAVILDTRKTTPGWRALEKYAVRCGGGTNHRIGLYDAVLIKDNHLAWLAFLGETDPISRAVNDARTRASHAAFIEVEVDSLTQFDRALASGPDIVLVDNFSLPDMTEAVRRRDALGSRVLLEASGGVNLQTVRAIAGTGVDRISVGALTHSAPALDIALDFEAADPPSP